MNEIDTGTFLFIVAMMVWFVFGMPLLRVYVERRWQRQDKRRIERYHAMTIEQKKEYWTSHGWKADEDGECTWERLK